MSIEFWFDKYGVVDAIESGYGGDQMLEDPVIIAAIIQIKIATMAIKARAKEIENSQLGDNE